MGTSRGESVLRHRDLKPLAGPARLRRDAPFEELVCARSTDNVWRGRPVAAVAWLAHAQIILLGVVNLTNLIAFHGIWDAGAVGLLDIAKATLTGLRIRINYLALACTVNAVILIKGKSSHANAFCVARLVIWVASNRIWITTR